MISTNTKCLEKILRTASAISLGLLALLIAVQVVARSFNVPFYWADELTGILLAFLVFFALPTVTRNRDHLKVEFLLRRMSTKARSISLFIIDALTFCYLAGLTGLIGRMAYGSYAVNAKSQGMLRISLFYPQAALVVGLLASLAFMLARRSRLRHPEQTNQQASDQCGL